MVLFVAGCFFNINIQCYFCDWLTRKRRAYANRSTEARQLDVMKVRSLEHDNKR